MDVVVIKRHVTDSWTATGSTFLAVAQDEEAARRWIQDEVDGRHDTSHSYAQGKDADWWIQYGTFTLTQVPIQT